MKDKIVLCIALLLTGCVQHAEKQSRVDTLPYYNDADFTPHWFASNDDSLKHFHRVPSFSLINQNGDTITEKTFANRIYVTDFFFATCPGICPKMTRNMLLVQNEFAEDDNVLILSHSVTPAKDTVQALKTYAENNGIISDKWHLVTGDKKEIYHLGRSAYFVEEDLGEPKNENDFLHTENFVLVDGNGHIRGIYNGLNKTAIAQLIADIKTLEQEM